MRKLLSTLLIVSSFFVLSSAVEAEGDEKCTTNILQNDKDEKSETVQGCGKPEETEKEKETKKQINFTIKIEKQINFTIKIIVVLATLSTILFILNFYRKRNKSRE